MCAQAPERFRALFGESLAASMLREAEENRDPARAATKKWQTFYAAQAEPLAGAKTTVLTIPSTSDTMASA